MRTLALDYGAARIGVAITDESGMLAQPLECIETPRKRRAAGLARVLELVREHDVGCIVIGLPLHMDGRAGEQAERTRAFAEQVAKHSGLPVEYQDERWSSREAERLLASGGVRARERKGKIDPIAAALLLETWLARKRT